MPQAFPDRLTRKANQLYWETARPAGQLAEELGVSRSKLYAMIEPLEIGELCDACGGVLVFGSRTDREAGRARCSECGATLELPEPQEPPARTAEEPDASPPPAQSRTPAASRAESEDSRLVDSSTRDLWLSAAVGLAVGLLAVAWLRRR